MKVPQQDQTPGLMWEHPLKQIHQRLESVLQQIQSDCNSAAANINCPAKDLPKFCLQGVLLAKIVSPNGTSSAATNQLLQ